MVGTECLIIADQIYEASVQWRTRSCYFYVCLLCSEGFTCFIVYVLQRILEATSAVSLIVPVEYSHVHIFNKQTLTPMGSINILRKMELTQNPETVTSNGVTVSHTETDPTKSLAELLSPGYRLLPIQETMKFIYAFFCEIDDDTPLSLVRTCLLYNNKIRQKYQERGDKIKVRAKRKVAYFTDYRIPPLCQQFILGTEPKSYHSTIEALWYYFIVNNLYDSLLHMFSYDEKLSSIFLQDRFLHADLFARVQKLYGQLSSECQSKATT